MVFKAITLILLLLCINVSVALCDTVVLSEDFSGAFIEHDWVYNNSSNNNVTGYGGQNWPCKIDADGKQLLGYEPQVYYATPFYSTTHPAGDLSGVDGWVGSGSIVRPGHDYEPNPNDPDPSKRVYDHCLLFNGQSAFRNVPGMQRNIQWVQCYIKVSAYGTASFVYVGTTDVAAIAAVVRTTATGKIEALNGNGSGGGNWIEVSDCIQNIWYRIRIKLDYAAGTYEVTANRSVPGGGLGFRDAAATSGLNSIKFEDVAGGGTLYVDDVYLGNSPFVPGPKGAYWSDQYNHWCVSYGSEIQAQYDIYDWMSCFDELGNPVNTDPQRVSCYKAALPPGWTAAFSGIWADWDPTSWYYSSGRGKMGFGPLMGAYAQSPNNRCLHVWSSHGSLRIASPPITTGPGVYTLSWKAAVWNGNTADPAMQYKWTDWCQWGFGYTNWCVWDGDPITTPPYDDFQVNQIDIGRFWVWQKDPFHDSDPDGVITGTPKPHLVGEEPGIWHSFTRTFAFGMPPVKGEPANDVYDFNQEPGLFIGFNIGHGHDYHNQGYRWATICNIDDVVLVKKDPVPAKTARELPVGSLVELADMVIVNIVPFDIGDKICIDLFLETKDRTAGMILRVTDPYQMMKIWDGVEYAYELGDVVNVVGQIWQDDPFDPRPIQPDSRNPVKYLAGWLQGSRLPAIVPKGENVSIKPLAISGRSAVGSPVTSGLSTDGMLVTVFGRVNTVVGNTFYVDDGSGLTGYAGGVGVKVDLTRFADQWPMIPEEGSFVSVTGTITAEKAFDHVTVVRTLFPRSQEDINPIQE